MTIAFLLLLRGLAASRFPAYSQIPAPSEISRPLDFPDSSARIQTPALARDAICFITVI